MAGAHSAPIRAIARRAWQTYGPPFLGPVGWALFAAIALVYVVEVAVLALAGPKWYAVLFLHLDAYPIFWWSYPIGILAHKVELGSGFAETLVSHLGVNLFGLWLFARPVEQWIGWRRLLAAFFIGGIAATLVQQALTDTNSNGASGALMVLLGVGTVVWAEHAFPVMLRFARLVRLFFPTLLLVALIYRAQVTPTDGVGDESHAAGLLIGSAYGAWIVVTRRSRTLRRWLGLAKNIRTVSVNTVGNFAQRHVVAVFVIAVVAALASPYLDFANFLTIQRGTEDDFLAAVVGALASILGITIAVTLVTFELLRKNLGRRAIREVFSDPGLAQFFDLFVVSILLGLLLLFLEVPPDARSDLLMLEALLFVASVVMVLPGVRRIVDLTSLGAAVRSRVKMLSERRLRSYHHRFHSGLPLDLAQAEEGHPVQQLVDLSARAVEERDRTLVIEIASALAQAATSYAKNYDQKDRALFGGLLAVLRANASSAISSKSEAAALEQLSIVEDVQLELAKKKAQWTILRDFMETHEAMLMQFARHGLVQAASYGCYGLGRVAAAQQRENCPPENEIWTFQIGTGQARAKDEDHQKSLKWDTISSEYNRLLRHVAEEAIRSRERELWRACQGALQTIEDAAHGGNLGQRQRERILSACWHDNYELHRRAIAAGLAESGDVYLWEFQAQRVAEGDPGLLGLLLHYESRILIELAKAGRLTSYLLNQWGTIGRGLLSKTSPQRLEATAFVAKVLHEIGTIVAEKYPDAKAEMLGETMAQVQSLGDWNRRLAPPDEGLAKELLAIEERLWDLVGNVSLASEGVMRFPIRPRSQTRLGS